MHAARADAASAAPPLNQFHFHSPSEHTINGMHYPLEMHMVHKLFRTNTSTAAAPVRTASSTPGATLQQAAVIGIMFAYECAPAPACAKALLGAARRVTG